MADLSLTQDDCMDDSDEGFEQGDCGGANQAEDIGLPPLIRIKKYAESSNTYDRQMPARIIQELFRTCPPDGLAEDIVGIMKIIIKSGEADTAVKADLLEQIPNIAAAAHAADFSYKTHINIVGDFLLPFVVRNLGCLDATVDKAANSTLLHLIDQRFVTKPQAEIQVCPSILALSKVKCLTDEHSKAVALMGKLAPFLGRDVMERVFLKRFTELCASNLFYVRKACASHFGDFCAVVGKDAFEKQLLPCFTTLCGDKVWGVRKSCAEVIMFVSCASSLTIRREMLSPIFVKFLEDKCRWVKMSAFHTLGPFIATFADPPITHMVHNINGDLVLISDNGSEFLLSESTLLRNLHTPNFSRQYNDDLVYYLIDDVDSVDWMRQSLHEMSDDVRSAVLQARYMCDDSGAPIEDKNLPNTSNDNNEATGDNNSLSTSVNVSLICDKNDTETLMMMMRMMGDGNDNLKMVDEKRKQQQQVIFNLESVNSAEDDNLHLYNSYNYWYISPDMAVDLSLIDGCDGGSCGPPPPPPLPQPIEMTSDADITSRLEELYSNINLSDTPSDISTIDSQSDSNSASKNNEDVEDQLEKSADDTQEKLEEEPVEPPQKIVPQILIEHFVSMTDPHLTEELKSDIAHHCAYSLPAVALTLGPVNWHLLKNTHESLAANLQYKIRRTIAGSLHELAQILGAEITTDSLMPLFNGFLKDLDEVKIGVLRHLAQFLKLISPKLRNFYLPKLAEFLQTDNVVRWRFRHALAQQLVLAVTLFRPHETAKHLGIIAQDLLSDKVAAVRNVALKLITEVVKYISVEISLTSHLLLKLAERFAHSKKWKLRQTFALLCSELLATQSLSPEVFASEVLPHLLDLSWDPVANVRLVVARTISRHIATDDYFTDPNNPLFDDLETVLRRLQADKDRDVRYAATTY